MANVTVAHIAIDVILELHNLVPHRIDVLEPLSTPQLSLVWIENFLENGVDVVSADHTFAPHGREDLDVFDRIHIELSRNLHEDNLILKQKDNS